MKTVFLTAGAAGMYCGSCMHDNALARALRKVDVDCLLQPVYTPIRTDEESIAADNVSLVESIFTSCNSFRGCG